MYHLLNRSYAIYRRTSQIRESSELSGAATASRTPGESYFVEVEVSYAGTGALPAGGLGTIRVSGYSGGAAADQVLDFAGLLTVKGNCRAVTTLRFDKNTAVTFTPTSWGSNPTVTARATRQDGSPLKIMYQLQSAWPGRIDRSPGQWNLTKPGALQQEAATIFLKWSGDYTPKQGDELTDASTSRKWRIEGNPRRDSYGQPHHWECRVSPQET